MIETKRDLIEYLTYEKKYYTKGGIKGLLRYIGGFESEMIWSFQKRLRLTEYYYNSGNKIMYLYSRVLLNRVSNKTAIHIGINVFDKGLRIMHIGSILTNGRVRVGKNCVMHINTALVAHGISDETPKIGNDVIVGVGATILGGVSIADGIAIGANSLVNKSFEERGIAVAGVPARKISDNGRYKWNSVHKEKVL